ncbi:MAG TPA: Stf0 family sulfotransferase, partial [Solirubrobacteraceae bacterium]|nr:Stf0 family sulfotransferase [Solirubrobacteraceae bacterium]
TARLDTLAGRAATLDGRMDALDARMDRLAAELAEVRELTAAIPRIAETTAALRRTLDERIQPLVRALADEEADNRRRLHAARAAAGHERAYLEADPLVSVTVATRGRERPLLERALPSLLAQTHANIEIVVVGDAAPDELERAVLALDDPRIRYSNLTQRISAHPDPRRHWLVGSTMARNEAARRARGSWLLHFDDDDHLREDAIASLLALARERRAEVAYGGFEEHRPDGGRSTGLGFPPRLGCFSWAGALVHSGLRFFERELLAAHLELPGDMYMLERMLRAGVRFAALDEVVLDYFPSTLWETPQAKTTTEPGPAPEPRRTPTAAAGRVQFAKDLLGPEHDNPRGGARPRRSYVLCSTPRTGSGLLARALAGTGALGAPLEYFNAANRELLAERWGCGTQLEPYLRAVHASRCSADGVFGAKVHWDQLAGLRAEADGAAGDPFDHEVPDALIERCFPQPTFVRVVRLDVDAQAVSYWRALETGVFSLASDEPTPPSQCPPYDFDGIERARRALEAGELCWERLIRARGAQALVVTYEELTGEYERTVARVAGFISPGLHVVVRAPRTRRLGDTRSLELRERYRAERATRARSDQPTS